MEPSSIFASAIETLHVRIQSICFTRSDILHEQSIHCSSMAYYTLVLPIHVICRYLRLDSSDHIHTLLMHYITCMRCQVLYDSSFSLVQ